MNGTEIPGGAGAKEEYQSLRTEQLYRMQGIHRVIGLIVTGFFASAILLLWGRGTPGAVESEKLFWTSPLLLGMIAIAAFVLLRWLRLMHRAGSYLVVFHENVQPNSGLHWHTRTLRLVPPKKLIDRLSPAEGAVPPLVLLALAACGPIGMGIRREICNPWPPSYKYSLWLCLAAAVVTAYLQGS